MKRTQAASGIAGAVLLAMAGVGTATGAPYFVRTGGSDAASGLTWAEAWKTPAHAVATAAAAGDVITVSNGAYTVAAELVVAAGVTLCSAHGYTLTTLQGSGATFRLMDVGDGAVVEGFTITGGKNGGGNGVVFLRDGATLRGARLRNNACDFGAVYMWNALVRNCLVDHNTGRYAGGIYIDTGGRPGPGTLENCTVVANTSTQGGDTFAAGVVFRDNRGIARNCIVTGNTDSGGGRQNWGARPTEFSFSCTTPDPGHVGITTNAPIFIDRGASNYRLFPRSPGVNAGTNLAWTAAGADLDGHARQLNGTVDMGAFETGGAGLICDFDSSHPMGFAPYPVAFTSHVAGANLSGISYAWSFTNAAVTDAAGAAETEPLHLFGDVGAFTVVLTVTNGAGEVAAYTNAAHVRTGVVTAYVAKTSSPLFPYTTWESAAHTLQAAIDVGVAGTLVVVSNGTYAVTAPITNRFGITVRSLSGYRETILDGYNAVPSIFEVEDAGTTVDGFTLRRAKATSGQTSTVMLRAGARLLNSRLAGNTSVYGAVYLWSGAEVCNCLITGNIGTYTGGLWYQQAATVENCTIVGNAATTANYPGGFIFRYNVGTMRNSIITGNTGGTPGLYDNYRYAGTFDYCCTTPDPGGAGIATGDPLFADAAGGDYHLRPGSPCVDTGMNTEWVTAADAADLDGNPRLVRPRVDMGVFERPPHGTLLCVR